MTDVRKCANCGSETGQQYNGKCLCQTFPGWTPASEESVCGMPLPTSMQTLSIDEVRQWAREAVDMYVLVRQVVENDLPESNEWLIESRYWAETVMCEAEDAIGHDDPVLLELYSRANAILNGVELNDYAIDLQGMELQDQYDAVWGGRDEEVPECENEWELLGISYRDWIGEECDDPEEDFEYRSTPAPTLERPDNEGNVHEEDENMNASNENLFVNTSDEEHREAIRSATYLLGAFGGLDNAREYLTQVSESLGHVPPKMPEGREQWVSLTKEQVAADVEAMKHLSPE